MHKKIYKQQKNNKVDMPGIHLYFRKVYSKEYKSTIGLECYMELVDEQIGILTPDQYMTVSEMSNQCEKLAYWQTEAVCRLKEGFENMEEEPDWIAMLISIAAMDRTDFADNIINIIKSYEMPADKLAIELPAAILEKQSENIIGNINKLHKEGCSVIICEYGKAYSNIMQLHTIPTDYCIIDESLSEYIVGSEDEKKMYHNLIRMVTDLDIRPIVDGINSKAKLESWELSTNSFEAMGDKVGKWFDEDTLGIDRRKIIYK